MVIYSIFVLCLNYLIATSEKPSTFWFERVVTLLWLVSCMLLSNSFAGTMRANLIVIQPTFRFKSLYDVLQHPEMTVVYPANTPAENMINVSIWYMFRLFLKAIAIFV